MGLLGTLHSLFDSTKEVLNFVSQDGCLRRCTLEDRICRLIAGLDTMVDGNGIASGRIGSCRRRRSTKSGMRKWLQLCNLSLVHRINRIAVIHADPRSFRAIAEASRQKFAPAA